MTATNQNASSPMAQPLHWVFKVGNLRQSLAFFQDVLGMHVLRHEEFRSGCDAQCNGPYARPWSKTMVGYGPEDSCFVLELTFNYGITKYPAGNDLAHIALDVDLATWNRVRNAFPQLAPIDASENHQHVMTVPSPDGYRFRISTSAATTNRITGVAIHISEARWETTLAFYQTALGYQTTAENATHARLAFAPASAAQEHSVYLELVCIPEPIDHAKAIGRLAIGVDSALLSTVETTVRTKTEGSVHTPLISLDTPGKATVEVVISLDPEGYEICTVGKQAFFQLAQSTPEDARIDWEERRENGSKE